MTLPAQPHSNTITIDAAGLHPATESSLEALQWLHERVACTNILDMGCGNGILSLAAASVWQAKVLAVDIAPQAIADITRQIADHHMEHSVTVLRSDGFRDASIHASAPYDLIVFNLLAEPIMQMASEVKSHLTSGGVCILSGILSWFAADVEALYARLGFATLTTIPRSPWQTFVLQKNDEK